MTLLPHEDEPPHVLAHDGDYRIEHVFEDATLVWNGGSVVIGDHYGDPTCAVMNKMAGWCATGGEGLVICRFDGGFPKGPVSVTPTLVNFLRRNNPPPSGQYWSVEGIWLVGDEIVRVLVDPAGEGAGLYQLNIRTLEWLNI